MIIDKEIPASIADRSILEIALSLSLSLSLVNVRQAVG